LVAVGYISKGFWLDLGCVWVEDNLVLGFQPNLISLMQNSGFCGKFANFLTLEKFHEKTCFGHPL